MSILANAEVDGEPLPVENLFSYFNLIVIAGNETTRNATIEDPIILLHTVPCWRTLGAWGIRQG